MKSLKALRFVATAMLVSNASQAMESKMATVPTTDLSTAIVEYKPAMAALGTDLKVPATKQTIGSDKLDQKIAHAIQTASPRVRCKALQYAKNCSLYTLQLAKSLGLGVLDTAKTALLFSSFYVLYFTSTALLFSSFYVLYFTSHELGHAVVAKLVDNAHQQNVSIHMLCGAPFGMTCTPPIAKIGFIRIHKDICLLSLISAFTISTPILDQTKNILMLLAGGSTGLLSSYVFLSGQAFAQKYAETKDFKKSAKFAITRAHTPFQNILEQKGLNKWQLFLKVTFTSMALGFMLDQIFYTFTPERSIFDGTKAWISLLGYNENAVTFAQYKNICDTFTQQPSSLQNFFGFNFNNATQCPIATITSDCYRSINQVVFQGLQIGELAATLITPDLLFDAEKEMSNCYYCNHAEEFNAGPATYLNKTAPIMLILTLGGWLYMIIKGANCYCSYVYGKPTTIFHVVWEKAIRPTAHTTWEKVGRPIVWEKLLKPQVEALATERRVINNFIHDTLTAPINTITNPEQYAPYPKAKTTLFMQAMYHCLRDKGSQAWDTVKGWFSCRKPKAA